MLTYSTVQTFSHRIIFWSFLSSPVSKGISPSWLLLHGRKSYMQYCFQICRLLAHIIWHPSVDPQLAEMFQCISFPHLKTSSFIINKNNHQHQYIPNHNLYKYSWQAVRNQLLNSSALFITIIICHSYRLFFRKKYDITTDPHILIQEHNIFLSKDSASE